MLISVIIPCYNSAETIDAVVHEVLDEFKKYGQYECEIILINDASKDNTFSVLRNLFNTFDNIVCIDFSRNFGQHSAIMAGLSKANGEFVLCMDDDGQTDPHEMFKLINSLDESTDVVYARYIEKKHGFIRGVSSYINDKMVCVLLNKSKDLQVTSYFIMKRYVVLQILKYTNPYPYVLGLVLRTTTHIKNVEILHKERELGKSGYSFKKLLALWINGFTSFSVLPLRFATLFGFVFSISGFIFAIYIIINKLLNPDIAAGWSSLISTILFTSGVILIVLGLLGEYIGRSFISINNSPQYVIREELQKDERNERA